MKKLIQALSFATIAHKDQRRKGANGSPFINHPIRVSEILSEVGGVTDKDILIAALLHDVVEDTPTSLETIEQLFGKEVAYLVDKVSDDKSLSKQERKRLQIVHVKDMSDSARLIKIADKIANMQDILLDPPDWKLERKIKYFEWAKEVIDSGLRGVNPALELMFDDIYNQMVYIR